MIKVYLSIHARKGKIHHTQIKQAAQLIEMPKSPKKNKDQYKTVNVGGTDIWLTYQWQDSEGTTIIYVKEAKIQKKKRKR